LVKNCDFTGFITSIPQNFLADPKLNQVANFSKTHMLKERKLPNTNSPYLKRPFSLCAMMGYEFGSKSDDEVLDNDIFDKRVVEYARPRMQLTEDEVPRGSSSILEPYSDIMYVYDESEDRPNLQVDGYGRVVKS